MEKKRRIAVVCVGGSRLARTQALKVAQARFPDAIIEVITEAPKEVKSLHAMIHSDEEVFEIKNTYKDIPLITDKFYDAPKQKHHPATLFKKGGKKQKNRYPNQRR